MKTIVMVLLILLSMAAGAAKLMQTPQEVATFAAVGLGAGPLIFQGLFQIIAGLLAAWSKTSFYGIIMIALGFFVSTVIIFMTGNLPFAFGSLIPIVFCIYSLQGAQERKAA